MSSTQPGDVIKYTNAAAIPINTVLATIDILNWPSGVSFQLASIGASGVITPEMTNDDTSAAVWTPVACVNGATSNPFQTTVNAAGVYLIPQNARFLRFRMSTASTAGTTTLAVTNAGENPCFAGTQGLQGVGAAASGNPVRVAGMAQTSIPTTRANGQVSEIAVDNSGKGIARLHAAPELTWQANQLIAVITDTLMQAAGAAGVRNYVTAAQIINNGAATEVTIKDGATVIWRGTAPQNVPILVNFDVPLKGTAATAVNVGNSVAGSLYVNLQGYQAA